MDDFQCPLCLKLLFKPVSITCGHTFCKSCLVRSLSVQKKCPICRVPYLFSPHELPVNILIQTIIQKQLPEELKERKAEEVQEDIPKAIDSLPVLLLKDVIYFPGSIGDIKIFEDRYMNMLHEATVSNRQFGILSSFKGEWLGALIEIVSVENNMPGVASVHILSRNRFVTDSIFTMVNASTLVKLQNISKTEYTSTELFYCKPEFIIDEVDDIETNIQSEVLAFTDACVAFLSDHEQRVLRETFNSNYDKSFYALSVLRIPQPELVKAYLSHSQTQRYEICKKFMASKRVARSHLRYLDSGPFKGNLSFLLVICVIFIIVFYEKIK